jgi:hypothetical protein
MNRNGTIGRLCSTVKLAIGTGKCLRINAFFTNGVKTITKDRLHNAPSITC